MYDLDSSSNGICQYPCVQSNTAKRFDPVGMREMMSLDAGNGCVGLFTNLFNWTRSTTERTPPFVFGTKDIGEHQSDTPSTFSMMPNFKSESIYAFAACVYAIGVFLGVQTFNGMTFTSVLMCIFIGSPFIVRSGPSS